MAIGRLSVAVACRESGATGAYAPNPDEVVAPSWREQGTSATRPARSRALARRVAYRWDIANSSAIASSTGRAAASRAAIAPSACSSL
jgi:hypothetical protein